MVHSPLTSVGLVLLTFMVPPTLVNFWLRMRKRRITKDDHVKLVSALGIAFDRCDGICVGKRVFQYRHLFPLRVTQSITRTQV